MSIDEIESEIDSIDREIEELEVQRRTLEKQLKDIRDGKHKVDAAEVKERCAALASLHLTGSERESLEDLQTNDAPEKHDFQRLKQIELNHLPETVFA